MQIDRRHEGQRRQLLSQIRLENLQSDRGWYGPRRRGRPMQVRPCGLDELGHLLVLATYTEWRGARRPQVAAWSIKGGGTVTIQDAYPGVRVTLGGHFGQTARAVIDEDAPVLLALAAHGLDHLEIDGRIGRLVVSDSGALAFAFNCADHNGPLPEIAPGKYRTQLMGGPVDVEILPEIEPFSLPSPPPEIDPSLARLGLLSTVQAETLAHHARLVEEIERTRQRYRDRHYPMRHLPVRGDPYADRWPNGFTLVDDID